MANSSVVAFSGNLVKDPDLRAIPQGRMVLDFRVAVEDAGGKNEAGFFDCVAWGDLADNLANSLKRGQRVMVQGRLTQRTWETRDGEKRTVIEVYVTDAGPSVLFAPAEVKKLVAA